MILRTIDPFFLYVRLVVLTVCSRSSESDVVIVTKFYERMINEFTPIVRVNAKKRERQKFLSDF